MAKGADNPEIYWVNPEQRGIFPLDGLIISHSLAKNCGKTCFMSPSIRPLTP